MLKTIFPPELEEKLMVHVPKDINYQNAMKMIEQDKEMIEKERKYYQSIFKSSIYDYCSKFNITLPQ